jgi:hypothetical protein
MRKLVLVFFLLASLLRAEEILKVDFTQTGGPVQSGYQVYSASHEQAATFTTQSYSVFGTIVSITPTWAPGASADAMQMLDRGTEAYEDATENLMRDWIGTDTRSVGDPMTLTIGGLPAGIYTWVSYHTDTEPGTNIGTFDVTVNDAVGSVITYDIQCTNNTAITFDSVAKFETTFTSDGINAVTLVFDLHPYVNQYNEAWFVMNGFQIGSNSPCYNLPPQVEGPQAILALVGRPVVMNVTVSDDGKPYVEGCDPADPQPGTAYPLEFQWLQQSGPGTAGFSPPSADQQAVTVTFPLQGRYELSLDVSDAPAGVTDRKTTRYNITVEVAKPLGGDVDFNKVVNLDDLMILASQWLSSCNGDTYCADLDSSGLVTLADYYKIAENWLVAGVEIVINEFVASNRLSKIDGDGNYSDWIELYNQSSEAVSLGGWFLTDDAQNPQKWAFPADAILPANDYLVVFASSQSVDDYVDPAGYLHTNFALDKDGEYLALVSPTGQVVHGYSPAYPPQETDISYGLWYDLHRYFTTTTPGQVNSDAFLGFTDKPNYSRDRGYYDQPFTLEITSDTPGAFIHYTLDGSEPTEQYGLLYDPNIPLQIDTTTVVRSIAIKPGYRPGNTKTATYIFPDDVAQQPANPPGWPSDWGYCSECSAITPSDYEMDPRVVNSTLPGYSIQEALLDIPSVSIAMKPDDFISDASGLWANPSILTEYKCSIEYIPVDGTEDFQEDCKIENHGGSSRRPWRMQKHNLRLTFTSEYGPAKLNYPLFPDSPVESFNQLILRASFTDSWGLVSWDAGRYRPNDSQYTRDVWMKESLRDMGQPSSYGSYVNLYVNGLYFGVFNLTESVDEAFCAEHLGGQREDWTVGKDFSGVPASWNTIINTNVSTLAGYTQALNYIDIENFADYMLLHFYADAEDWPHHNGIVVANTISGDGKLRFFVWDQEIVLDNQSLAANRIDNTSGAGALFQKMRTSEEFRLLFADRAYKHCFNDGALNVAKSQNRYLEVANKIDKAIVAESARWGDTQLSTPYGSTIPIPSNPSNLNDPYYPMPPHGPDYYFTREDSWLLERDCVVNHYIPDIFANPSYGLINLLRNKNLYPGIDPPVFNIDGTAQHGGHVDTDAALTMTNPNASGTIYYTVDGSDPRLPGGVVNTASSAAYSGAVTLSRSTIVKARIKSDTIWSALAQATYAVGPVAESLRISEIMYHPADPNTEFVELKNVGADIINLNMAAFTNGISFTFPDIDLAPNAFVIVVLDASAFAARYPTLGGTIAGQYAGSLDNAGEKIELGDAIGTVIHKFSYKDGWYELTDGQDFSLTVRDPLQNLLLWSQNEGWRTSLYAGGTPGSEDTVLAAGSIVINEVMTHSHNALPDWIELFNTTGQDINIGGWFLTDNNNGDPNIMKYEIPSGTVIHANDYLVFVENVTFGNPSAPGCNIPFGLSEGGETVYLYSGEFGISITGLYQTEENFDASETGITFGRYEKAELSGGYDFTRMISSTQDGANSGPLIPDMVITEIYYNPPQGADYEFVELYNRSGHSVTLMSQATTETSPGVFVTENLPWRLEGTGYEFPANTVIAPGEYVIIAKDPTLYISLSCDVYGPYDGKLDNAGEQVEIQMPGDQEYGKTRYWIPIEKIDYDDAAPWPTSADGAGDSLHRMNINAYGRDYSNWNAGTPTPGT